jgi:formylglycine-generating enzyme required for sulfatase activity
MSEPMDTRDLMRRYNEEKGRNIRLARDLLNQIRGRQDVPRFFDVEDEDRELQAAERRFAEEEKQRQRMKQAPAEYEDLAYYVSTADRKAAHKAIRRFMQDYPDYGDPQDLRNTYGITSLSLLPAPFDWIEIPGKGYSIAKYPITNAQFAKFIETGGYQNQQWWTKAGWARREKDKWTKPRYWTSSKWNGVEQPVVGVSWVESVAFCLWLSDVTGEKIMLPTEAQWQYAAQGTDGREYPWGKQWDASRCNNNVDSKGIGKTSPVRQYEGKGDSPFGVVDMAGNVWEWCLTDYENKTNDVNSDATLRVLRGGSWVNYGTDRFRCDYRDWYVPHGRDDFIGFRISCS